MSHRHRDGIIVLALAVMVCLPVCVSRGQETPAGQAANAEPDLERLLDFDNNELGIALAPLPLDRLEAVLSLAILRMQRHSETLAAALIEQVRLRDAAEPDAGAVEANDEEVGVLMTRKAELVSRANVVIAAVVRKGGDIAAAQAYISAIEALVPEDRVVTSVDPAEAGDAPDPEEGVRQRVAELVAIIRAEPPAHERPVPWAVPLSEFELELQPLPVESVLERLGKWREILQREVRKRVRIDILLNDAIKLNETRARRQQAAEALGVVLEDVDEGAIKSLLAERSQEQQQIINEIVRRMEVAILLVERRGGDASVYTKYIGAATGQKLNLTDLAVLRAQVFAWIRSPDGGVSIGLNMAGFLGIVGVFWIVSRGLRGITAAAVRRVPKASSLLGPVLAGTVQRVTMIVGLVIGLSMLGVNIGPLLALIGAAGLVIGLALQGTLSNFASGILILLNRPYDVGHVIEAGGVLGKVEAMNLVSTSILTFDNKLMLVPNNQIWNGVITNVGGKPTRRVDLIFGIGYADNMDEAVEIIRAVITAHPKVHADPEPTIRVHELGDNSVNVIARPWTATADYWEVYWDVMHGVKARFDERGINIPFPQRDVHIPGPIEIKLSRDAVRSRGADDAQGRSSLEGASAGAD